MTTLELCEKPLVGVPAAAQREWQIVAATPIDHDADRAGGLAQRAQLWGQRGSGIERFLIVGELRIARTQKQRVG